MRSYSRTQEGFEAGVVASERESNRRWFWDSRLKVVSDGDGKHTNWELEDSVVYAGELVLDLESVFVDGDNVVLLLDGEDDTPGSAGGADHDELLVGVDDDEKKRNRRDKRKRPSTVGVMIRGL
ncbi:hypothetical protein RIF29_05800 [Crotalaria pallida]|uniref:Uncharacterized protein n=1 Tax=Crotalaria pallida TaxID=3830 RepID=A0AAN9J2G5_CROPI